MLMTKVPAVVVGQVGTYTNLSLFQRYLEYELVIPLSQAKFHGIMVAVATLKAPSASVATLATTSVLLIVVMLLEVET
jgi:hypothetical protein